MRKKARSTQLLLGFPRAWTFIARSRFTTWNRRVYILNVVRFFGFNMLRKEKQNSMCNVPDTTHDVHIFVCKCYGLESEVEERGRERNKTISSYI